MYTNLYVLYLNTLQYSAVHVTLIKISFNWKKYLNFLLLGYTTTRYT